MSQSIEKDLLNESLGLINQQSLLAVTLMNQANQFSGNQKKSIEQALLTLAHSTSELQALLRESTQHTTELAFENALAAHHTSMGMHLVHIYQSILENKRKMEAFLEELSLKEELAKEAKNALQLANELAAQEQRRAPTPRPQPGGGSHFTDKVE